MKMLPSRLCFLLICLGVPALGREPGWDTWLNGTFPPGFLWGYASASYQVEGGWDADGKGLNIWDEFSHAGVPEDCKVKECHNGDIACDSYNKYKEDVQLLKASGADYYRFSISWSRIIPTGRRDEGVNFGGIQYYNNLINELIANGIQPMVTLYHWDLPLELEKVGGWWNETIIPHFADYADTAYFFFGDRVKLWITMNEPWVFCILGYNEEGLAPGRGDQASGGYRCGHTVLKAHAEAYHIYVNDYKATQQGRCGITLDCSWYEPEFPNNTEHQAAAERAIEFKHGWLGRPLFFGEYPKVMRDIIDERSRLEGLPTSRLPSFTPAESARLINSFDFLGLNHYTTEMVRPKAFDPITEPYNYWTDQDVEWFRDPTWEGGHSDWLKVVPWGFRRVLNWLKDTYNNPEILVTENGFSDDDNVGTRDVGRINFYRLYINEMLKAVIIDNVNVTCYTAWSILDNFEWSNGYTERFGVHWVNFTDPERPRYPKSSVAFLKTVFDNNGFP